MAKSSTSSRTSPDRPAPRSSASWRGFVLRLLLAAGVVYGVATFLDLVVTDTIGEIADDPSWLWAALEAAVVSLGAGGAFLASARLLRLTEALR